MGTGREMGRKGSFDFPLVAFISSLAVVQGRCFLMLSGASSLSFPASWIGSHLGLAAILDLRSSWICGHLGLAAILT